MQNDTKNSLNSLNSLESTHTIHISPHIDYIIFLDSDDYWEKECVEECVRGFARCEERGESVEIVWFEFSCLRNGRVSTDSDWMRLYGTEEKILIPQEWIQKTRYFWLSWSALIDFKFLKSIGLRFLNGVLHEDGNFGIMLFMQAQRILRFPKTLYYYRIREQSIMNPTPTQIPPAYLQELYFSFKKGGEDFNAYNRARSFFYLTLQITEFFDSLPQNDLTKMAKQNFLPTYIEQCFSVFNFYNDPLNLRGEFYKLLPYMKRIEFAHIELSFLQKTYVHPFLGTFSTKLRVAYLWQRDLERRFRRWRKGRKNLKCDKAR
nr:glycosyltransferase [Helicobacter himalayensis]